MAIADCYIGTQVSSSDVEYKIQNQYTLDLSDLMYYAVQPVYSEVEELIITKSEENYDVISTDFYENILLLESLYDEEYLKEYSKLVYSKEDVDKMFEFLSAATYKLPFIDASVQLSKMNSIKLTLIFGEEKTLMLTKPLVNLSDVSDNDVVLSFFIGDNLVISDVSNIYSFVTRFSEYLSS